MGNKQFIMLNFLFWHELHELSQIFNLSFWTAFSISFLLQVYGSIPIAPIIQGHFFVISNDWKECEKSKNGVDFSIAALHLISKWRHRHAELACFAIW